MKNIFRLNVIAVFLLVAFGLSAQIAYAEGETCTTPAGAANASCCKAPPIVELTGGCAAGQYWIGDAINGGCKASTTTCSEKFSCLTGSCVVKSTTKWARILYDSFPTGQDLFKIWYSGVKGRLVNLPDVDCLDGSVPSWNNSTKTWSCVVKWVKNSNDLYYTEGKVSIGTSTPLGNNAMTLSGSSSSDTMLALNIPASAIGTRSTGIRFYKAGAQQWAIFNPTWQNDDLYIKNDAANRVDMSFQASTGNVGIGITSPSKKLDVSGDVQISKDLYLNKSGIGADNLYNCNTVPSALITVNGQVQCGQYHDNDWQMNGTNIIYSLPTQSVGIGTASPSAKLDVEGGVIRAKGGGNWPSTGKGMEFGYSQNAHKGYIQVYNRDTGQWGTLYLGNGNVGIGTANPNANLTVVGSTTLGFGASAGGNYATATGLGANASGDDSFASGWFTTASNIHTVALGSLSVASGPTSVALGDRNTSSGANSFTAGMFNEASKQQSTAMGYNMKTRGDFSFGIGLGGGPHYINTNNVMAIMGGNVGIGIANPSYKLELGGRMKINSSDAGMWFEAGTSDWFIGRSGSNLRFYNNGDKITILPNGKFGIGTTNPQSYLSVGGWGSSTATISAISNSYVGLYARAPDSSGAKYGVEAHGYYGVRANGAYTGVWSAGGQRGVYASGTDKAIVAYGNNYGVWSKGTGNDGIGVYGEGTNWGGYFKGNVYVGGDLNVTGKGWQPGGGSWGNWSDRRLKDLNGEYTKGLDEIVKLKPYNYRYKKDNPKKLPSDIDYVGFVAQEVQEVFPEAVSEDERGDYLGFDMHPVNVAVINAIKELKVENDKLKADIKGIKLQLNDSKN